MSYLQRVKIAREADNARALLYARRGGEPAYVVFARP